MPAFPLRMPLMLVALALSASACSPLRQHQGYIVDADLVNAIQPGVDNRDSVRRTLGEPTLTGQFTDNVWYYVARDARYYAFNRPKVHTQTTLRITFDANGNVVSVDRANEDQVASIHPYGERTPTLGRERGFFEELFGNIGTVGAAGMGAPGGSGN